MNPSRSKKVEHAAFAVNTYWHSRASLPIFSTEGRFLFFRTYAVTHLVEGLEGRGRSKKLFFSAPAGGYAAGWCGKYTHSGR